MSITPGQMPIAPCHEDPLLGEQEVTPLDIEMHSQLESIRATRMQAEEEDPLPLQAAALSHPAFFTPADKTRYYFGNQLTSVSFSFVRAVVWHSTETSGMPGYQSGKSAPNLTAMPDFTNKKIRWYHHYRLDRSARALVHPPGMQTNNDNVVQVELVGTTAKGGPGLYLPDAPDWWWGGIAEFMTFMRNGWGVPLTSQVAWESYPDSYGRYNGVRLNSSSWHTYKGHLAHQHVWGNLHGDVWLRKIKEALKTAGGTVTPPPPPPKPPVDFPKFPLPAGWWFGPANGGPHSISGLFSYKGALKPWLQRMKERGWPVTVGNGVYNRAVNQVALDFQREKHLVPDGLIGKQTWDAAWTTRVTT